MIKGKVDGERGSCYCFVLHIMVINRHSPVPNSHDEACYNATRRSSSGSVQQCTRDLVTTVLNSLEMLLPEQLIHAGTTAPMTARPASYLHC